MSTVTPAMPHFCCMTHLPSIFLKCTCCGVYQLWWGCVGIILGGGMGLGGGWVGASVDSVLGIDVVSTWENSTADWDIVRINATNHPDLFWGMLVSPHRFRFCYRPCILCLPCLLLCYVYWVLRTVRVCACCTLLSQISLGSRSCGMLSMDTQDNEKRKEGEK